MNGSGCWGVACCARTPDDATSSSSSPAASSAAAAVRRLVRRGAGARPGLRLPGIDAPEVLQHEPPLLGAHPAQLAPGGLAELRGGRPFRPVAGRRERLGVGGRVRLPLARLLALVLLQRAPRV